jgi:hypothetical protein
VQARDGRRGRHSQRRRRDGRAYEAEGFAAGGHRWGSLKPLNDTPNFKVLFGFRHSMRENVVGARFFNLFKLEVSTGLFGYARCFTLDT